MPRFLQDRSPRSARIFQTVFEVATRELADKQSLETDVLRRIARSLERTAQSLPPQRTAARPAQWHPHPLGEGPGTFTMTSQAVTTPQMARVQSAPYSAGFIPGSQPDIHFPGTGPTWPTPFQPPLSQSASVISGVPPSQPSSQNPQQQWPDWLSQFTGNLGMVFPFVRAGSLTVGPWK